MDACSCIILIFFIILSLATLLLLLSMDTLEPLQYGITLNKITKSVGDQVYDSGRYIIGPWNSFIVYPAKLVTIEFSQSRRAHV